MSYDDASTSQGIRKRAPRMSLIQANYLANFMLKNKQFAMRNTSTEDGEKKRKEAWKRLAMELNSFGGANKKVEGWKKAWLDLKRTSKLRVTKILKDKAPGIDIDKCNISDLDRRVLEAVGIAMKIGEDYTVENDDEDLTFVEVKDSDDSGEYLDNNDLSLNEYNEDDVAEYISKDKKKIINLSDSIQESSNCKKMKYKRTSSCSETSEPSNYSDDSANETKTKRYETRRSTKKTKVKKKTENQLERVLQDLQSDYTKGLKAIADAILKIGENKNTVIQPLRRKRIPQPWFHYMKFDD